MSLENTYPPFRCIPSPPPLAEPRPAPNAEMLSIQCAYQDILGNMRDILNTVKWRITFQKIYTRTCEVT